MDGFIASYLELESLYRKTRKAEDREQPIEGSYGENKENEDEDIKKDGEN